MVCDAVEFFPYVHCAGGIPGWLSRMADCANGGKDGAAEICEARATVGGGEKAELTRRIVPLLVDLEREWRGGQNQFFLLLKGLYERGYAAELLTAKGSSLGHRAEKAGFYVHYTSRSSLLTAARKMRALMKDDRFDVVHVNESQALTAAWLARAHRR